MINCSQVATVDPTKKDAVAVSKDVHVQIGRFAILHSLGQENNALLKIAKVSTSEMSSRKTGRLISIMGSIVE